MKRNLSILLGKILILFLLSFSVNAQDSKKGNQKMNNILADTTFVRASEITLKPGEITEKRSYPINFFYALTNGKIGVRYDDGTYVIFELKQGVSGLAKAERPNTIENISAAPIKILIVELKEHPYIASNKVKKK